MAYREVTMIEIKEVLRQWLAGARTQADRAAARARPEDRAPVSAGGRARAGCSLGMPAAALTEERLAAVVTALRAAPARPTARAGSSASRSGRSSRGTLRARRAAVEDPPAAPAPGRRHPVRDAVPLRGRRARLRARRADDPGRGRRAGRGDPRRHRLDDAARARRARPAAALPRVDLHAGRVALPLRLPVLRRDDGERDRGVRGRVGVLRRRVPGRHPRQHEGDRHDAPIRSSRGSCRFLEYAQARGFHVDPARVRTPTGQGARRAHGALRPRRLLRGEKLALARARPRSAPSCGAARRPALRRHSRTQRLPREHFEAVEQAALLPAPTAPYDVPLWCDPKVARDQHAQVARALYSLPTQLVGRDAARARRSHDRALLRRPRAS